MTARTLLHLRLYPGTEAEFDRRLRTPPSVLADAVREGGIRSASAFRRGTDVWWYGEADDREALDRFHAGSGFQGWLRSLVGVVAGGWSGDDPTRYDEVFHSDGPALGGPSERGMFLLVVHPDRIAEYDARHADPWPEMLEALSDAGFRNYSGFRSGSLVAYYGEFYPNMSTALAKIGATDVNRRWSESFHGIITTLTDEDGRLFTAPEVVHLSGAE